METASGMLCDPPIDNAKTMLYINSDIDHFLTPWRTVPLTQKSAPLFLSGTINPYGTIAEITFQDHLFCITQSHSSLSQDQQLPHMPPAPFAGTWFADLREKTIKLWSGTQLVPLLDTDKPIVVRGTLCKVGEDEERLFVSGVNVCGEWLPDGLLVRADWGALPVDHVARGGLFRVEICPSEMDACAVYKKLLAVTRYVGRNGLLLKCMGSSKLQSAGMLWRPACEIRDYSLWLNTPSASVTGDIGLQASRHRPRRVIDDLKDEEVAVIVTIELYTIPSTTMKLDENGFELIEKPTPVTISCDDLVSNLSSLKLDHIPTRPKAMRSSYSNQRKSGIIKSWTKPMQTTHNRENFYRANFLNRKQFMLHWQRHVLKIAERYYHDWDRPRKVQKCRKGSHKRRQRMKEWDSDSQMTLVDEVEMRLEAVREMQDENEVLEYDESNMEFGCDYTANGTPLLEY